MTNRRGGLQFVDFHLSPRFLSCKCFSASISFLFDSLVVFILCQRFVMTRIDGSAEYFSAHTFPRRLLHLVVFISLSVRFNFHTNTVSFLSFAVFCIFHVPALLLILYILISSSSAVFFDASSETFSFYCIVVDLHCPFSLLQVGFQHLYKNIRYRST